MNHRFLYVAVAAAGLTVNTAAFAQESQQPQSSAPAATTDERGASVTLTGCLMRESDYRKANSIGTGGAAGTGAGAGDEYVLVNATTGTSSSDNSATCANTTSGSGQAYELSGAREHDLGPLVGRRIQISGMLKSQTLESAPVGTSGTAEPQPTGGFDPLGRDLNLREVDVMSFSEVNASASATAPAASAAAPAASPEPAAQAPQPTGTSGTQNAPSTSSESQTLPSTASPLPLIGIIGLFSLLCGIGLRRIHA